MTALSLSAAAQDRKARLAQLQSLKRKAPTEDHDTKVPYLSGRNYDVETQGPKLGFESAPSEGQQTVEKQAAELASAVQIQARQGEEKPLHLFTLQPKKANWDLKRELDQRLKVLNVRTDNAIARIVRERAEKEKKSSGAQFGGENIAAAAEMREMEDKEQEQREEEEDEALLGI